MQALRFREWQRPHEDAVDDAEHRDRRADAERERQDCGGRECWSVAQRPRGILEILEKVVDEPDTSGVAALFLALFDAADHQQRLAAGRVRRQAARHVRLDQMVDVKPQLLVELSIERRAAEQ